MANLRRSLSPTSRLAEVPSRPVRMARRWPLLAALAGAGVVLAWIDGGEEPLHPIEQAVDLPEQPQ